MVLFVAGCSSSNDTSTNAGATPPPDSTPAGTVGTLPPLTMVPPTGPPTTTSAAPKPAKAPPDAKTPTTRAPKPPPVTKFPPTTVRAPETKNFCQYLKSIDINVVGDWVAGFMALHVAVQQAQLIAPPAVAQPLADIKAALDAAQPAVDDGTMTSSQQLKDWIASQPSDIQIRLTQSFNAVGAFTAKNCK